MADQEGEGSQQLAASRSLTVPRARLRAPVRCRTRTRLRRQAMQGALPVCGSNATDRYAYKARMPFLPRFGLTVASTPPVVSAPLRNACFSAAANAWLAAISCSRSAAESTGTIGGPDLLW
jgi:hypothetical protein